MWWSHWHLRKQSCAHSQNQGWWITRCTTICASCKGFYNQSPPCIARQTLITRHQYDGFEGAYLLHVLETSSSIFTLCFKEGYVGCIEVIVMDSWIYNWFRIFIFSCVLCGSDPPLLIISSSLFIEFCRSFNRIKRGKREWEIMYDVNLGCSGL